MYINIKPLERFRVYTTPEQAIQHLWIFNVSIQRDWRGVHFGRDLATIRRYYDALKAKDFSAFVALPRKGFWRVEMKG
jgi:hypothetical protein